MGLFYVPIKCKKGSYGWGLLNQLSKDCKIQIISASYGLKPTSAVGRIKICSE